MWYLRNKTGLREKSPGSLLRSQVVLMAGYAILSKILIYPKTSISSCRMRGFEQIISQLSFGSKEE